DKAFADKPVGNGLFKMASAWEHDKGIKLVRNDDYGAGPKAYLDAVEFTIVPNGSKDEFDGFNNGTFDSARIPTPVLTQARADNPPKGRGSRKTPNARNSLLRMVPQNPLAPANARRAISMAIDRNAIVEGVFKGSQPPPPTLVPPVFKNGYQP